MTLRLYDVYPVGGKFSAMTRDYHGVRVRIFADSIRLAYALAYREAWAKEPGDVGIIEVYTKGGDARGWHRYWCGCHRWNELPVGGLPSGIRAVKRAMTDHVRHFCDSR